MTDVARINLSLTIGEDYVAEGTHRSAANGAAVDIGGWTITVYGKRTLADTEYLFTLSATLANPTVGRYNVAIPAATSGAFTAGDIHIEAWRVNTGAKTLLASGILQVKAGVRTPA